MTDFHSEQLDYDRSGQPSPRPQAQKYANYINAPPLPIKCFLVRAFCVEKIMNRLWMTERKIGQNVKSYKGSSLNSFRS